MKCLFCGSEDVLVCRARKVARGRMMYDAKEFCYHEAFPSQYMVCKNCGHTELFSILREMRPEDVEAAKYDRDAPVW